MRRQSPGARNGKQYVTIVTQTDVFTFGLFSGAQSRLHLKGFTNREERVGQGLRQGPNPETAPRLLPSSHSSHPAYDRLFHGRREESGVPLEVSTPEPERDADVLVAAFFDDLLRREVAEAVIVVACNP